LDSLQIYKEQNLILDMIGLIIKILKYIKKGLTTFVNIIYIYI